MNYKTAYNKIIDAYFKDEIKPLDPKFCFCGTLCDNSMKWQDNRFEEFSWGEDKPEYIGHHYKYPMPYTISEFKKMEWELIITRNRARVFKNLNEEDALFEGMCAALDVLKKIHRERGENVDEEMPLTKRQLQTA